MALTKTEKTELQGITRELTNFTRAAATKSRRTTRKTAAKRRRPIKRK